MRRLFVLLASACTQDFDTFQAHDAAAVTDTGADASTITDAAKDGTTATDSSACTETGAITFGGHCYFLLGGNPQTFQGSRDGCIGKTAHLVTVNSDPEQAAIQVLGNGTERWIGLMRSTGAAVDASYQWINGEPRGYSHWNAGEPNGSGSCARLVATGEWGDTGCTTTHPAICERD